MSKKRLLVTDKTDPEWVNELVTFLVSTENKDIIKKYKKLFRDSYLSYINDGYPTKVAIEKAKKVVLSFEYK
jgi:hypothetical protein